MLSYGRYYLLIRREARLQQRAREAAATIAAGAKGAALRLKEGAPQVPLEGSELKPQDLTGPAVWNQNKEQVRDVNHGEAQTRREQGKSIEEAGGKSDKV